MPFSGLETAENGEKGELIKSLNIRNAEALEARVRKELEEQGILDPNDEDNNGDGTKENDEINDELVRCQVSWTVGLLIKNLSLQRNDTG